MKMSKKPNILLLVNDHQAYYRHGWDGGIKPLTPNLDRISNEGSLFNRAYTTTPLCSPSRRTMLTGLYPHNHHNYYNYTDSPYDHEIYLDLLAKEGYKNFYFGKWHAGPGTGLDFNCKGFSDTDYGNPYIHLSYKEYLKRNSLPQAQHHVIRHFWNEAFRQQFPKLKDNTTYRCEYAWCGELAVGLTETPKETHESFFLANLACDALTDLAKNKDEKPFHISVNFWGPHHPHFPTSEFVNLYNSKDIIEYGSFSDTLIRKPQLFLHDFKKPLSDKNNHFRTPSPLSWEEWQQIIVLAYAHITMVDAAGGMIIDKLFDLGLDENTIVIWTADHGDGLASHGGQFDKGTYVTEEVMRVPLAVRWPEAISPHQIINEIICNIDLAPTILDMAGIKFTKPIDGQSWLPLLKNQKTSWREALLTESFGHGYGVHHIVRAIHSGEYKYIYNHGQINELYHLGNDQFELNNLVDDTNYKNILDEMILKLKELQADTGDIGVKDPNYQQAIRDDKEKFLALQTRREEKVQKSVQINF